MSGKKLYTMKKILMLLTVSVISLKGFGQAYADTSRIYYSYPTPEKPIIELTPEQAVEFLERYTQPHFWHNANDPLRKAIEELLLMTARPSYSTLEAFFRNYQYDSINIPWENFFLWDTLYMETPDSASVNLQMTDSIQFEADVINIQRSFDITQSDSIVVFTTERIRDTLTIETSFDGQLPFRYYYSPYKVDSLEIAVSSLINYLRGRDSVLINITGRGGEVVPMWFNARTNNMTRYWLRNDANDSIIVWVGNAGRDTIGLFVERGVEFRRPLRQTTDAPEARINVERQNRTRLLEVQTANVRRSLWRYRTNGTITFNQTGLTNWQSGENTLTTALDVTSLATYNNRERGLSSNNSIRLRVGATASGENPLKKDNRDNQLRKNTDILEVMSNLDHRAFGRFDFSANAHFRTQLLKGYTYPRNPRPDDPVRNLVSSLLNPANLTVGLGLSYKPNAQTTVNFSPLAYNLTFMTDTTKYAQKDHGIPPDKKALHRPGVNFVFQNTWRATPTVPLLNRLQTFTMTNRLQLFTNYIDKPQNVDIDWELTIATRLSWNTELRVNTHLIFKDDVKTPVFDKDKNPVMVIDPNTGREVQKRAAQIQFRRVIGLTLAFVF